MNLFFRKFGGGPPFIILHGLYGSSDNWVSIGRELSAWFEVYLLDLRNHGRSPHSPEHSYKQMAGDLKEFMDDHQIQKAIILGHSMGGKAAMKFACLFPERITHLIVLDIAPKSYLFSSDLQSDTLNHKKILQAMLNFDFSGIQNRDELDERLAKVIRSRQVRQFLLKNVKRKKDHTFDWIINVQSLFDNLDNILDGFSTELAAIGEPVTGFPVLFIKGAKSEYITKDDEALIKKLFPYADIHSVPGVGHWLHAEEPVLLLKSVLKLFDLA
jgi:esterase